MKACVHRVYSRSPRRRGVTLIAIVIVVSIIDILAAVGGPVLSKSALRWHTRGVASEFSAEVEKPRALAIADNVE